jgi:hypothetical protein
MKKIILQLLLLFSLFFHCSSGKNYIALQTELENKETFERTDVHKGLKGNFLFYVSNEESEGDIFLYNVDINSRWKLTSIDRKDLEIISLSTFYKYIVYYSMGKNFIYDVDDKDKMDFVEKPEGEYSFSRFESVNWIDEKSFYFLSSTNSKDKSIFLAKLNDDNEWSFQNIYIPDFFVLLEKNNIEYISLSHNKNLLAFIARDSVRSKHIFILDLKKKKIKKLVPIKNVSKMIWSENNGDIFYYEISAYYNILYSINLNGAKKLIVSQGKRFYDLVDFPKFRYKFFYITTLNDYYFIHMYNIDYIGIGNFLFNVKNLKNAVLFEKSDFFFYDNTNNEIYLYNTKTTEIRKILSNASLIKL